jgi:hypothetical protein
MVERAPSIIVHLPSAVAEFRARGNQAAAAEFP